MLGWQLYLPPQRREKQSRGGLEVVPEAAADLLLEAVKELGLVAHAVEVLQPEAEQVAALAAPLPAGLQGHIAAEIVFLPQQAVDGEERCAAGARRLGGTEIGAELEFPRLRAAIGAKAQFASE